MDRRNPPETRRDFLGYATWGMGLTAVGAGAWTVLGASVAPEGSSADDLAINLDRLASGEYRRFVLADAPLLVWRRTPEQVAQARKVDLASLRDPLARNANLSPEATAEDERRSLGDVIVVWARCTRSFGCVPEVEAGDFGGWFCNCGGAHYDLSGRIRKGPAPRNLAIPRYEVSGSMLTVYRDGAGPVSDDQLDQLLRG